MGMSARMVVMTMRTVRMQIIHIVLMVKFIVRIICMSVTMRTMVMVMVVMIMVMVMMVAMVMIMVIVIMVMVMMAMVWLAMVSSVNHHIT
jgi:hypothetical protein